MSDTRRELRHESGTEVVAEEEIRLKRPNRYRVVILNDDYTPMDFVVWVLELVFHKPREEATRLMLDVHHKGRGVCGVFAYDIARTKADQVRSLAERHEHPLQCVLEVAEGD